MPGDVSFYPWFDIRGLGPWLWADWEIAVFEDGADPFEDDPVASFQGSLLRLPPGASVDEAFSSTETEIMEAAGVSDAWRFVALIEGSDGDPGMVEGVVEELARAANEVFWSVEADPLKLALVASSELGEFKDYLAKSLELLGEDFG